MIVDYNVTGVEESLKASGLPMSVSGDPKPSLKRCQTLGKAKAGSGHDCFLKGINVIFTVDAPLKWFDQFYRYAFQDTVSSTSQMHKLLEVDFDSIFTDSVDQRIIGILYELKEQYENNPTYDNYRALLDSIPQGFVYRRCITTNYLQLKTMYFQRKHHKLHEWHDFCDWIESLPLFKELVLD